MLRIDNLHATVDGKPVEEIGRGRTRRMIDPRLALLPLAVLTGCVSDFQRSSERWREISSAGGPYSRWASCIEDRSYRYLDLNNRGPDEPPVEGTPSQLFTQVLADCRTHMAGPAWEHLSDDQARRLIADAHWAFERVDADIMDRDFHAIIGTETDARN